MRPVTIFSWGYFGWGNATSRLLEAVDAIEGSRGFAPPVFVDVRMSRSVRAVGFRERAFEVLLGTSRYRWMRSLGNRWIESRQGPLLQIAQPEAAEALLSLAIEEAARRRRLIFFCSCGMPVSADGVACHRVEVGRLLCDAARRRGIPITLVEWPGDEPTSLSLEVPASLLRGVRGGRKSVPLMGTSLPTAPVRLAVGSIATLRSGSDVLPIATGPVRFGTDGWYLPVLQVFSSGPDTPGAPQQWVTAYRERHGYDPIVVDGPLRTGASHPARAAMDGLASSCIYTIVQRERLEDFVEHGGAGTVTEGRAWTTGARLLNEATAAGLRLPILFADSCDCSRLLYQATLQSVELTKEGTRYSFEGLTALPRGLTPQDLVLRNSRRKIASGFIRPYAICETPSFLLKKP